MSSQSYVDAKTETGLLIKAVQHPETLVSLSLPEWDRLLRYARISNLVGRIAENIEALAISADLPKQIQPHLAAARVLTSHQRLAIKWEIRHISKALENLAVPKVLLKGAAYVVADLDAARGRLFSDVDLLVPRQYVPQTEAELMLYGWSTEAVDHYDDGYYRKWMHEIPPMVHRKRGTVLDLHHNILPLTARSCPKIELFLADIIPSPVADFSILAPVDMILHSACHLFYESELRNGLRDLFDLDALIRQFSAGDAVFWPRLMERAFQTGLRIPLFLALCLLREMLATEIDDKVFHEVKQATQKSRLQQAVYTLVYRSALRPAHPLIDTIDAKLCRFIIHVRGHYQRMPYHLLIPHLARKAVIRVVKTSNRTRNRA